MKTVNLNASLSKEIFCCRVAATLVIILPGHKSENNYKLSATVIDNVNMFCMCPICLQSI